MRTAKHLCSVVINHGTMEAIAEAMVRSRFNLIIPCSYIDPRVDYEAENLAICARRGLFLSQHHHDPLGLGGFMFLNHWEAKGRDYKYSYFSHPREVEDMWREAARAYAKFPDVVWQIGFRGISDSPMWEADKSVPTSDVARAQIISDAMAKQVEILKAIGVERPYLTATLWGEGAVFNEKGLLKVPDGATVVYSDNSSGWWWPKDFYETPQDAQHTYGIYYHHQLITAGPHFVPGVSAARTLMSRASAAERDLAFDAFVYPVTFMHAFTCGMAEFADAFDLYALGDTSGAASAAQRGLAALESAEALDARYCRGKWIDWHKCRVQVPFPKIIEQARALVTDLATR